MTLKALIFDVDGTLSETEEAHRSAFNQIFSELSLDWHWDVALYKKLLQVTGGKERIRHFVAEFSPGGASRFSDFDDIVKMHGQKTTHYQNLVKTGAAPLRIGVARLLGEARHSGIKLAIATTTNPGPLEALFAGTLGRDALEWFDAIAAGDMVSHKKPAPDVYQLALEGLGLAHADCLAIEDSKPGLASAKAAGIATIITQSVYTVGERFDGALAVISDLGEPDQLFQPINGLATEPGFVDLALLSKWHDGQGR